MKTGPLFRLTGIFLGLFLLVVSSQSSALTIVRNFDNTNAAPGSATGTGNLQDIFNAAADWWEAAILDAHVLTLTYGWAAIGGTTLGRHTLTGQSGGRETSGTIIFDNDDSTNWWIDDTPFDASEFSTYTEYSADLGGGVINTGRVHTGGMGDAGSNFDLFNTVIHEIGHALGLSSANTAFQAEARQPAPGDSDIDVNRAGFAGTVLPVRANSAHYVSTGDTAQASLGRIVSVGSRHMLSCVDILGNAQISQFTNFDCDPRNPGIPTPGSLALFGAGLLGWVAARRRWLPARQG